MKKTPLLLTLCAGISFMALTGYTSGPAAVVGQNHTGAAGSSATCGGGGCHAGSSAGTTINGIALIDNATSLPVTNNQYMPGHVYNVIFTGSNNTNLPKFGFQFAATKANNTQAGTITASAANTHVTALGGLSIVEHSTALNATGGSYISSFTWAAPAAGSGAVTFYGMLNAVNGNGQNNGDQYAASGFTAAYEEASATGIATAGAAGGIRLYPNPATTVLRIALAASGNYTVQLYTVAGQLAGSAQVRNSAAAQVDVAGFAPGGYVAAVLQDGKAIAILPFVKQ